MMERRPLVAIRRKATDRIRDRLYHEIYFCVLPFQALCLKHLVYVKFNWDFPCPYLSGYSSFHAVICCQVTYLVFSLLMQDANRTCFRGIKLSKYFKLFPQKLEDGVDILWF